MMLDLAVRNLWRQPRRTAVTLAAVVVGTLVVVGVRGFLNGIQDALIRDVTRGTFGALQIHKKGYLESLEASPLALSFDAAPLLAKAAAVDGVAAVAARIPFGGLLAGSDASVFAPVVAVDLEAELKVCPRRLNAIQDGAWPTMPDGGLLMSRDLARGTASGLGTEMALLSADVDGVMNGASLKATGTLRQLGPADPKMVLIPLHVAQELLRMPGRATEVVVAVHNLEELDVVRDRLALALGGDFEVHTWKDLATMVRDAQAGQNAALSIVSLIFFIITLFGVANTLLMAVLERVREIGTMLAVGMRRRKVVGLFVTEAALLGILGATIGALLGLAVVTLLGLKGLPIAPPGSNTPMMVIPRVELLFVLRSVVVGAVGAMLAALYPAWKASKLRPVEALNAV